MMTAIVLLPVSGEILQNDKTAKILAIAQFIAKPALGIGQVEEKLPLRYRFDGRYEVRYAERSRTGSVLKEATRHTLEVVPPFDRLHTPKHGVQIDQTAIATGASQRGRGNLWIPRHGCRSDPASPATHTGCLRVAHPGNESNRLAVLPARNHVHCCGRAVPFWSVEVSIRSNSDDKVLAACDLPVRERFTRIEHTGGCPNLLFTD